MRDPAYWIKWRIVSDHEDGSGGTYEVDLGDGWRAATPQEVAEIEDRIARPSKYGVW